MILKDETQQILAKLSVSRWSIEASLRILTLSLKDLETRKPQMKYNSRASWQTSTQSASCLLDFSPDELRLRIAGIMRLGVSEAPPEKIPSVSTSSRPFDKYKSSVSTKRVCSSIFDLTT